MSPTVNSTEPVATIIVAGSPDYHSKLIRAMNWYSLEKDKKEARMYLKQQVKTLKPDLFKTFDQVPDDQINCSYAWISRILQRGSVLDPSHVNQLKSYLETLNPKKIVRTDSAPRKSVVDYTQERSSEYIGELEGILDQDVLTFSLLDDLKAKSIPQPYVPHITKWVKVRMKEFLAVYDSKELQDAYRWSKTKAKVKLKLMSSFLEDLEKYSSFRKANRKPKAKKARPPAAQVKALKYKTKDEEINIQSISPLEIVGASQVWFYNTKTKKLALYKTESLTGIQVKGTTLQNYQPELSSMKTLRKPEQSIQALLKAGKVQLRKFMDELSTKPSQVNGRINTDMLILRAIK